MPQELIVFEESRIQAIANNDRIVAEFSFLKPLRRPAGQRRGCGKCGARHVASANGQASHTAMQAAKVAIANLGPEKKRRLLQLVDARQGRVVYRRGGKLRELTFSL